MKFINMSLIISLFIALFTFNACTIEGEELCGTWYTSNDYGNMKIEITPWKGKFYGYLLEYDNGKEIIKGEKTEDYIILTDLVFEEGYYKNGKLFVDPQSKESCAIDLRLLDDNQLSANYDCNNQPYTEIWTRNKISKSIIQSEKSMTVIPSAKDDQKVQEKKLKEVTDAGIAAKKETKVVSTTKAVAKPKELTQKESEVSDTATKRQRTFKVIGVHETVAYNDMKALTKVVEQLWTKCYTDDFSGKLSNIADQEKMYAVYSDYDQPKGKMTITIGYKVKDLSNVPVGLKGITVPVNDYYVYPMSGNASDYEGEGWKQLEELMMYRDAKSVDFETYTFDNNYEVTEAFMWIASK